MDVSSTQACMDAAKTLHAKCRAATYAAAMDCQDRSTAFALIERDMRLFLGGTSVCYNYAKPDARGRIDFSTVKRLLEDIQSHLDRALRGEFTQHLR
jgi:hypothetical protein